MRKQFCSYIVLLIVIFFSFSCTDDEKITNGDNIEKKLDLVNAQSQKLEINDFNIELNNKGEITNGIWKGEEDIGVLFLAGLWIAVEDNNGFHANIISAKSLHEGNYITTGNDKALGTYYLEAAESYSSENWPVENGAPIDNEGLPKVYGDAMVWTSLYADSQLINEAIYSRPINNLQVTQSVFGYAKDELSNVIFIKYGITNLGSDNWDKASIGFYSDTDLFMSHMNRTGYDKSKGISFTYDTVSTYTSGFAFIETPKNVDIKSHRIMRKNDYFDPDFGEFSFTTSDQIKNILSGLSNSGDPMIDPTTNLVTTFAFTGDPVAKTGWLDVAVDVRSLISTESFTLSAGETTWVTLAFVVNRDLTLEESLTKLKEKIDHVKSDQSLWDFN